MAGTDSWCSPPRPDRYWKMMGALVNARATTGVAVGVAVATTVLNAVLIILLQR